jgi:hypothetical protein
MDCFFLSIVINKDSNNFEAKIFYNLLFYHNSSIVEIYNKPIRTVYFQCLYTKNIV